MLDFASSERMAKEEKRTRLHDGSDVMSKMKREWEKVGKRLAGELHPRLLCKITAVILTITTTSFNLYNFNGCYITAVVLKRNGVVRI